MNIPAWEKNYMLVSWLFLISASFTLAKTLRDAHEVALMERSSMQVQEQEFKVQ